MIQQSLFKPCSISFPTAPKRSNFLHNRFPPSSTIRCEATDSQIGAELPLSSSSSPSSVSLSAMAKLMESSEKKSGPYPSGLGPHTGRDPNVKKPEWLRQRAPQGERFQEIKESLSHLNLNTVCEDGTVPHHRRDFVLSRLAETQLRPIQWNWKILPRPLQVGELIIFF